MIYDVNTELRIFFTALAVGMMSGMVYCFAKSTEVFVKKQSICDVIKVIFTAFCLLCLWQKYLFGYLRWYVVLGILLGVILYFCTIGKAVFYIFDFIMRKICCFLNIILKILLTIIKKLGKILDIYAIKMRKSHRKVKDNEKS